MAAATEKLKAPYPAFGGKSRVAALVWSRLGDCDNFIEPFCNSAAVLLGRPSSPRIETLNDLDCQVANFWRAIKHDPEGVAAFADDPVSEADLHARHRWLMGIDWPEPTVPPEFDRHPLLRSAYLAGYRGSDPSYAASFRRRMRRDPGYYDVKFAGWWVWGACCWIGGGWCSESAIRSDGLTKERLPRSYGEYGSLPGVHASGPTEKRPVLAVQPNEHGRRSHVGHGVHAKADRYDGNRRPAVSRPGANGGVHGEATPGLSPGRRPAIGQDGWGVNVGSGHRPQLADAYARGRGVHGNDAAGTCDRRRAWLCDWFGRLADRLRAVRVCCGHWLRVCDSESVTTRLGSTGIFFDPPYAMALERMHAWVAHLGGAGPEPTPRRRASSRSSDLYANDGIQDVDRLVAEVHLYCAARGKDPRMRIALAGYAGEHEPLEALGWSCVAWEASGGYGNRSGRGKANAARERIWFSPGCSSGDPQRSLLDLMGDSP